MIDIFHDEPIADDQKDAPAKPILEQLAALVDQAVTPLQAIADLIAAMPDDIVPITDQEDEYRYASSPNPVSAILRKLGEPQYRISTAMEQWIGVRNETKRAEQQIARLCEARVKRHG